MERSVMTSVMHRHGGNSLVSGRRTMLRAASGLVGCAAPSRTSPRTDLGERGVV